MGAAKLAFAAIHLGLAVGLMLLGAVGLAEAAESPVPSPTESYGTLEIDRPGIESMSLLDAQGTPRLLNQPGPRVLLMPGEYRIQHINLQGKFQFFLTADDEGNRFVIKPGQSHRLHIGELTPNVRAHRRGRTLQLDCDLTDAEGRKYLRVNSTTPRPQFTVYAGEIPVGSGDFEYG